VIRASASASVKTTMLNAITARPNQPIIALSSSGASHDEDNQRLQGRHC
jgi:hypothetical protein